MTKFFGVLIISLCVFGSGCDKEQVANQLNRAEVITQDVNQILEQAEPAIGAVENATGQTIPAEISGKTIVILNNTKRIAETAQTAAPILNLIPGAQPYVGAVTQGIGLIGLIATSLGAFFQRRKAKANAQALKSTIIGADFLDGAGKAITEQARKDGCADLVESVYQETINSEKA